MRRRFAQPVGMTGKINVTPLIDVVMCLIIFYLLVGRLALDRQGGVELPGSSTGQEEQSPGGLIINVLAVEGAPEVSGGGSEMAASAVIDGRTVSAAQLVERLKMLAGSGVGPLVQIRADRRLTYGAVAPILAACREAELKSVLLTTRREERPREEGKP